MRTPYAGNINQYHAVFLINSYFLLCYYQFLSIFMFFSAKHTYSICQTPQGRAKK
jgi:hypothetical protein